MLVGMTGVGGGSLMTPLLILLFGIHPATAVGTDLLYAAVTKTGGSLVHGFARSIDWRVVRRLSSGSIPATVAMLAVLSHFNLNGEAARSLITMVLSGALFFTAFILVFGQPIVAHYRARVAELDPRRTAIATILVGVVLGALVSISSVGAGAIGVVAADASLPASADGQDRRLRHRARGAADIDRRPRSLDDGLGRLAHYFVAAGRLVAGYFRRQLFCHPGSGTRIARYPGDDLVRGGKPHRLRSCHHGVVDLHRVYAARGRVIERY